MSYINQLREAREGSSVAFQDFALLTRSKENHLFAFFEGKDNPYYIPRINFFHQEVVPISCGGKAKVLKVHHLIKSKEQYKKYKKAFFIDLDFNKTIGTTTPPIYETTCYSIENKYTSQEIFKNIVESALYISEASDPFYHDCIDLYSKLQEEFNECIKLFNAWYACLIEIRDTTGKETGVNLDDKLPKGFVEISLDEVKCNYGLDRIQEVFPNALSVPSDMLENKLIEFSNCDKKNTFRGKYQMQFMLKYIELLIKDSITEKKIATRKINFVFGDASGMNNSQAIMAFSPFAKTPAKLNDYIKSVLA